MDLQSFRNQLEKDGYSYEQAREDLRNSIIIKRLQRRKVVNRITVTDSEIDNFLANQKQQDTVSNEYHLWYILIAMPEAPSPEDIEAKQRKAEGVLAKLKQGANFQAMAVEVSDHHPTAVEGGDLGWLKAGEIRSLLSEVVSNMAVGEVRGPLRDPRGFHIIKLVNKRGGKSIVTQSKVRHILIQTNELVSDSEAQLRLERLRERIVQGDDFVELARAHSDDVTTAANGGLLPDWLTQGDFVPEFEEVVDSLPEKQISKPFKSRYGWHIAQVLERRKHDNTKQALRTQAELQISQRKMKDELEVWLRQLREEAYIEDRLGNF
jgi:peptidyl-prolyl cis-trans isomerase SurA